VRDLFRNRDGLGYRYDWRHFDSASAEVLSVTDIAAGVSVAGTTEAAVAISPTYPGSGAAVGTQTTAGRVGGSVFWKPGLTIEVLLRGTITTGATPGTLVMNWRLDTITGASLGATASLTLIASQTTISWDFRGDIVCRSVGTSGTLMGMGRFMAGAGVFAAGFAFAPASAPTTATIDTTANHQIIVTMLASNAGTSMLTQQEFWRTRD
jgi:hypothetical protein